MSLEVKKINLLKSYFEKEPQVLMAFVFGSRSTNLQRKASDWDIAIYLEKRNLKKETKIWSDLVNILEKEVDLVCLNEAPPVLAGRIARQGIPLKIKSRDFFLSYLFEVTERAEYFLKFTKDYYKIYQRSRSLSETDKARLRKILIFLNNSLDEFEKFKKLTFKEYSQNIEKRRNVERWIENIMNAVLDASKILLASKKKAVPETYQKIISEAGLLLAFNKKDREKLSEWAFLRNIIAHSYLEELWGRISPFLKNSHSYLNKFVKKTEKFIK